MNHKWYYRIETEPGAYTSGRPIATLGSLKDIYTRIDFDGANVLDIGTQEFVNPILMRHHGAANVTAYDRLRLSEPFEFLKSIYDLDNVDYVHGVQLLQLRNRLVELELPTVYDFVNFTGVLYHMPDPLTGLAIARSFLRQGGIMLLETSVQLRDDTAVDFNTAGRYYPGSNYFQPSAALVAYWCNMLRLEVLDASWLGSAVTKRLFLVLRATSKVIASDDDEWITKHFVENEFAPYGLDYAKLSTDAGPFGYTPVNTLSYDQSELPIVDVVKTLAQNPSLDEEEAAYRNMLHAEYEGKKATRLKRWLNGIRGIAPVDEASNGLRERINDQVNERFKLTHRNSLNLDDVK